MSQGVALADVRSAYWQPSPEPGLCVQGLDDIRQCIRQIVSTPLGREPTRPDFGCGAARWLDKPLAIAVPQMIRETVQAIRKWEPRVQAIGVRVRPNPDGAGVVLAIGCTSAGGQPVALEVPVG